eukprot:CAMPEP_0177285056 /NCGR_PEP_ID=MMETSP0367-20130122/72863_1 /TAXON_ID=447022 ORGANISM="Scrippsiella hangoei-like, Strain SHHI-4" /NCGR_SAMPLE_ID=MMETSP0367 /ASSEMBLY_ACC=CAM_ASM_000362 /LENGTH=309 /DNA_ID=CAMNT_0018742165 /DNA_START=1 /DNA_END=931 /DNA_ORIENTATION=-
MQVALLSVEYDTADETQREQFLEDFRSRIQLTYRSGLSTPLSLEGGKEITSDSGWGCMLRVTQMMLAQCFVSLTLGRAWRYQAARDLAEGSAYKEIISCFLDVPKAPFSLHKLVTVGSVGDAGDGTEAPSFLKGVACVAFEDGAIFKSLVLEKFAQGAGAVILLVCRRLGLESFNVTEYRAGIEQCFKLPEFQGLASGNNSTSAHFFVGTHDDCLVFLDPHRTLPGLESVDAITGESGLLPPRPLPLRWASLNPSICAAFLVRSPEDFTGLCAKLSEGALGEVFEVLEKVPSYASPAEEATDDDMVLLG